MAKEGAKLGAKVRSLRRREELTQVQLAQRLGISASYLNLIEHHRRPLSAQLLIRLAQLFNLDLPSFAADDEGQLASDVMEAFSDPMFEALELTSGDVRELASNHPHVARAVIKLYQAYRGMRDSASDLASAVTDEAKPSSMPSEEIGNLIQKNNNYFPDLEDSAEMLWRIARLDRNDMFAGLVAYLDEVHGIKVKVLPSAQMNRAIRRYDQDAHTLYLSEVLAGRSRCFQIAHQIALIDSDDILNRTTKDQTLTSDDSRALCRVALANYFAAAVLMPYARFLDGAEELRYDLELLGHRFGVGFEQVAHRLCTMQRPGAEGVPFHMVRIDVAGNISKRFSASGFRFARFSGACPKWNEHASFLTPGMVRVQLNEMPDGMRYFSVARTVWDRRGGFRAAQALHAVGVGCEIRHAKRLVYAEGIDLENADPMAIGVACRVCERRDCVQRAFPPLLQPLKIDENLRGRSFYMDVDPQKPVD